MVVGVSVAGYYVFTQLDSRIEREIEQQGSAALGVAVEIDSVSTDLTKGTATVSGLSIANPSGFEKEFAMQVSSIFASIDYTSRDIKQITVDSPVFNAEIIAGANNFQKLLENSRNNSSSSAQADDASSEFTIRQLLVKNAVVYLAAKDVDSKEREFAIADLRVNNLQGTPEQIAQKLSRRLNQHLIQQIRSNVSAVIRQAAQQKINEEVNKLGDRLRDKLREELVEE